ncbi:MAG: hypothetical protein Q7S74_01000 [Nanoarchaeota archaeon]|nr:hypothetical protein [Nanoarchaeota archaeon]
MKLTYESLKIDVKLNVPHRGMLYDIVCLLTGKYSMKELKVNSILYELKLKKWTTRKRVLDNLTQLRAIKEQYHSSRNSSPNITDYKGLESVVED